MLILGLTTADARSKLAPSGPGGVPAEIPSTFVLRNALDRTTNKEYESETTEEELKRSVKFGLEKCNLFYGIDWIPVDNDHGEPRAKRPKTVVAPPEEHLEDSTHPKQETLSSVNTTDIPKVHGAQGINR